MPIRTADLLTRKAICDSWDAAVKTHRPTCVQCQKSVIIAELCPVGRTIRDTHVELWKAHDAVKS